MIRLLVALLALILSIASNCQDSTQLKKHLPATLENEYCANFKGGKMILMANEKVIKNDLTLLNGNKLTSNCAIIKKDGSMQMLKAGECVDKNGNVKGTDKTSGMNER